MRTRGQKLKQKQQGLPASPPLQLATPPRRPRVIKKVSAQVQSNNKQSLDSSSEIIFNFSHLLPSPKTPRQPIALDRSSAEDSKALPNGCHEIPVELDTSSTATDSAASKPIQTGTPATVPATPHTLLHLWLDAAQEDLASARPGSNPTIAMALPSSLIPDLLHYITRLANSTRTNTLTLNASSIGISPHMPSSNKRKLGDDAENSQAAQRVRVEISQKPKRQRKKGIFSRMPLQDLETSHHSPTTLAATPRDSHGPATTFTRDSLYSKDGNLQLGLVATSQVISTSRIEAIRAEPTGGEVEQRGVDERISPTEEVSTITHTQIEDQPVAETPRSGRWGFGDLLKSARSVSKFLPGFQRAVPVPAAVIEDGSANPNPPLNPISPAIDRPAPSLEARSQSSATQTAQPESPQPAEPQGKPDIEDSRRRLTSRQNRSVKKGMQVNQKKADRDRNLGASNSKALEYLAEGKKGTTSGTKRKRMSSPDIIPNPGGSSYGMDLDYFGFSSSGEEDEMISPTKTRPSKHRRLRGPDKQETMIQVDTGKAQPYRSGFFSSGTVHYEGGNVFDEVAAFESSKLQAKKSTSEKSIMRTKQPVSPRTPITNLTGSFRVPSPSDSDSDPEDSPTGSSPQHTSIEPAKKGQETLHSTSASPIKPSPRVDEPAPQREPFTIKGKTSRTQSPPSKAITSPPNKAPTTWTQPPPPRPNPSHAALPSVSSSDSEALARARKKALHYQPHKPSGLRASSRISSPRILEDNNLAVVEGNTSTMNQTSASGDFNTALAARSENAVAGKLGQTDTSTNSERMKSSFEKEAPKIAMIENSNSLTAVEPALSSYVRDPKIEACVDAFWKDENTKQASDMFEVLYTDFLAKQ